MLSLFLYRVAYTAICQGCRSIKLESQMRGEGGWRRIREFANSYCCVFFILIGIAQPLMVVWLVGSFEGLGSLVPKAC